MNPKENPIDIFYRNMMKSPEEFSKILDNNILGKPLFSSNKFVEIYTNLYEAMHKKENTVTIKVDSKIEFDIFMENLFLLFNGTIIENHIVSKELGTSGDHYKCKLILRNKSIIYIK